jgi:hypothetical protein
MTLLIKAKSKKADAYLKHLKALLDNFEDLEVQNISESKAEKLIASGAKDLKKILAGKTKGKLLKDLLNED